MHACATVLLPTDNKVAALNWFSATTEPTFENP